MSTKSRIFGYDFICEASYNDLAEEIIANVSENRVGLINMVTPNAHSINVYRRYPALEEFCRNSYYILPDGQPIVWLSRFTNNRIKGRLTGSDFFPVIFEKILSPAFRALFVVSDKTVETGLLKVKPDTLTIVPVFFDISDEKMIGQLGEKMADVVLRDKVQFVFVGISDPKQAAIIKACMEILKEKGFSGSCIFFGLGASFQFYLGLIKRAPQFFRKTGLEWFYRLISEPGRMYKRYIFGNISFVGKSMMWILNKKVFDRK